MRRLFCCGQGYHDLWLWIPQIKTGIGGEIKVLANVKSRYGIGVPAWKIIKEIVIDRGDVASFCRREGVALSDVKKVIDIYNRHSRQIGYKKMNWSTGREA